MGVGEGEGVEEKRGVGGGGAKEGKEGEEGDRER